MYLLQYFFLFLPEDLTAGDAEFSVKMCGTMFIIFLVFIIIMALASYGEKPSDNDDWD